MAVGDVVSDIFAAGGASPHTFRPAAGVEICLLQLGGNSIWSGVESVAVPISGSNFYAWNTVAAVPKLFITNDVWLVQKENASYNSFYSGIQTK